MRVALADQGAHLVMIPHLLSSHELMHTGVEPRSYFHLPLPETVCSHSLAPQQSTLFSAPQRGGALQLLGQASAHDLAPLEGCCLEVRLPGLSARGANIGIELHVALAEIWGRGL